MPNMHAFRTPTPTRLAPPIMSNAHSLAQSTSTPHHTPSKRWQHFHSALHLAIQRTAHKWTFEDFSECFEEYCKADPDHAKYTFQVVSEYQEKGTASLCEEFFTRYNAPQNIDILHQVVTEARARRSAGEAPGKDAWRPDLDPRMAVRARTVPILRNARDELKAQLAKLEEDNLRLQAEMVANVNEANANDAEESRRLDLLDEIFARWGKLPIEDIQEWTLRAAENMSSSV